MGEGGTRFLEPMGKEGAFCSRWERRYLFWPHFESKELEGRVYAPTSWIRLLWSHCSPKTSHYSRSVDIPVVQDQTSPFSPVCILCEQGLRFCFCCLRDSRDSKGPTGTGVAKCRNVQRWLFGCSPGDRSGAWAASTQGWYRDSASTRVGIERL